MAVAARSRPEIDMEEAIGTFQFSVVPHSLLASDGALLQCRDKSNLIQLLESCHKVSHCQMRVLMAQQ